MKVAIAGGAGRQCLAAIYDFLEQDDVEQVLLLDRNEEALHIREALLHSEKVETKAIDITEVDGMAEALADYDVVLNGSSHVFNMPVMDACIESRTHYTDFGGLYHWALEQLKRSDEFERAGITGIVGSGSAPGITNVMAKYAADRLDTVDTILLLDVIVNPGAKGYSLTPPYSLNTILDEFTADNFELIDGELVELPPFSGKMTVEFPQPYGVCNLYNMIHSELATMPLAFQEKGIRNVAFKLALPAAFEERLRFLVENGMAGKEKLRLPGGEIAPRDLVLELFETRPGAVRTEAPQDCKLIRAVVEGTQEGKRVKYEVETDLRRHPWGLPNGVFSVGFPGAVTARLLGNGLIKEKGFFSGESVIDTELFFRELARRDVHVYARKEEEL